MKTKILLAGILLASASSAVHADGRKPGSVLVYPVQRSGTDMVTAGGVGSIPVAVDYYTLVCLTNTNTNPTAGATNVHMQFVNVQKNPDDAFRPLHCNVTDRVEYLTPADTRCFLANCFNPGPVSEGYLVVSAQDPNAFQRPWAHNYLVGSEIVVHAGSAVYELNAIPFSSPQAPGSATDLDGDGELDFDGVEYEGVPDELYIDVFTPMMSPSLALLNLTGSVNHEALVKLTIFNDNEFPLSATFGFQCWFDEPLAKISLIFTESFLAGNTPDDPSETDTNCDSVGDMESGWARLDGIVANSAAESIADPALLGAVTAPDMPMFNLGGGRLLWESMALQTNGDFVKFGVDDPEN